MANEVNITITGTNLSGPAFTAAREDMAKLAAEAAALKGELAGLGEVKIDVNSATASLIALRSKMQALGIADIADVNVQPGRISTQLNLLKRLIDQAGISDILDVNINKPQLTNQLQDLAHISETIPINFKIGEIPQLPKLGETGSISENLQLSLPPEALAEIAAAQGEFQRLGLSIDDVNRKLAFGSNELISAGMAYMQAEKEARQLNDTMNAFNAISAIMDGSLMRNAFNMAALEKEAYTVNSEIDAFSKTLANAALATQLNERAITPLIPLWQSGGGWLGFLTGKLTLFGGALGNLPIVGSIAGWHLLTEAIIETGGTLIPATLAFAAFGAAAVPTVKDLYSLMQSTYTTTQAFGQSIYPLTGGFQKVAQAVQPEVYVLFGEGLIEATKQTGIFQTVATGAGKVLDDLGARFVYATTQGQGMQGFMKNAVSDLAGWGNLIGNIGGIIGNILKVIPGYAQIVLQALGDVTHALEMITGSSAGQAILGFGLAAHGAVIWIGALATAATFLVTRGLNLIEGVAASGAIKLLDMGGAAATAGKGLAAVSDAAATAGKLPWGWIITASAALIGIAVAFAHTTDAAQQFNAAMQGAVNNAQLGNLNQTIMSAESQSAKKLSDAVGGLSQAFQSQQQSSVVAGRAGELNNQAYVNQTRTVNEYQQGLASLVQQQDLVAGRVNALSKQYGGQANALALLNGAGITTAQILDQNKGHWAEAEIEIQAYANAMQAATQSAGRLGAAQNALNFSAGDSANALGQIESSMNKVVQSEDSLINVVTSGETAFNTYATAINQSKLALSPTNGLAAAAAVAGASIDGLNNQSLNLSQTFFGSAIPAAQKVIDTLQQQNISTKDLTSVIATQAGQLLSYAGNSDTARAAIIAMINNALGPGTVSMQNLNQWVSTNTTTMAGFKAIVDKSEISAGSLANVLATQLNTQFQTDILQASGASKALSTYTQDLANNTQTTAAGVSDRAKLIQDLENSGFSAQAATNYVDGLTRSLHGIPSNVNTNINVSGSGSGGVQIVTSGAAASGAGGIRFVNFAGGGRVSGGIPGVDSVPIMAMPGEAVVPVGKVPMVAPALSRAGVPGFGKGGIVGLENGIGGIDPYAAGHEDSGAADAMAAGIKAAMDAAKAAVDAAAAAAAATATAGPGGGTALQNQALARQMMPAWSAGLEWGMWQALWNQESGWNQYAYNASSGATGIPQALPYTKMPQAAWLPQQGGQANPHAQIGWGIGYIQGRYGDPITAEQHELAYNWYDHGGWLPPGKSIAMNGTGKSEWINPPNGGVTQLEVVGNGSSAFEAFMLEMIRNFVRIKGGGSAQRAFGRPGVK